MFRQISYLFLSFNSPLVNINITYEDEVWRQVVRDIRFRQALNLSLNRQEIIDTLYVGDGKPAQPSPVEESPHYHDVLANQYLEYLVRLKEDGCRFATGSDSHAADYAAPQPILEILETAGFTQDDLWAGPDADEGVVSA